MAREDEKATFLEVKRRKPAYRPVAERIKDFDEVAVLRDEEATQVQASRCLKCATPFCHWSCPVGNVIPEFNQHLASGEWDKAYWLLQSKNNLPEMTGRLCPALCEAGCALTASGDDDAVTNRENELAIIEYAFRNGLVKPRPPQRRTGRRVAVIGSGPSGLACADQLNKAGHYVTLFERDERLGGMLRYGIPDFKLPKRIIDRRTAVLEAEGIAFRTGVNVGTDIDAKKLRKEFDAVCLAGGSRQPRDLPIEGRDLSGIAQAMTYLSQSNRRAAGDTAGGEAWLDAKDKKVVVIGGGDTGADCVGTALRQGAADLVQIEILPEPPRSRAANDMWPDFPRTMRSSSSHEEGGRRLWAVTTKRFAGENGAVKRLECAKAEMRRGADGRMNFETVPGTEFTLEADLVILAMGFVSPEHQGLLDALGVNYDARGNVATDDGYSTSVRAVFAMGDMHRGQSLVTWAISEGRRAAHHVDKFLMGNSRLPLE